MEKQLTTKEVKALLGKLKDEECGKLERRLLRAFSCGTLLSFLAVLVIAIGFQPIAGSALLAQVLAVVGVACLAFAFISEIVYIHRNEI